MTLVPEQADILAESLNNPARFAQIAERHLNAVQWKRQDYIPLGIVVNDPDNLAGLSYDQWQDAAVFFEVQANILRDTLIVGSDCLPALPLNHLGDVLIPTMFGAELLVPTQMAGLLQDQGPSPWPILNSIEAVDELQLPSMTEQMMPAFARIITSWREWAPQWVQIVTPFPLAPLSLACELRGSGFFLDLIDDPKRCARLLSLCVEIQAQTELYLRSLIGPAEILPISNFGIRSRGRRIGDDSIIMLSADMIKTCAVPYIENLAARLGPATVHFCTLAQRRSDHVFEALADSPHVDMASSQFAFEYYEENVDRLQGRLAIEALYGGGKNYVIEKYGSFEDWAKYFVPRFKKKSGLILYLEVSSVEEGRELWQIWQSAHILDNVVQ